MGKWSLLGENSKLLVNNCVYIYMYVYIHTHTERHLFIRLYNTIYKSIVLVYILINKY